MKSSNKLSLFRRFQRSWSSRKVEEHDDIEDSKVSRRSKSTSNSRKLDIVSNISTPNEVTTIDTEEEQTADAIVC